jgi:hypothetical protein
MVIHILPSKPPLASKGLAAYPVERIAKAVPRSVIPDAFL